MNSRRRRWENEISPGSANAGWTFIWRTPVEIQTCRKLKKCSNFNINHSGIFVKCRVAQKLRISSAAAREIIFKFDFPWSRLPAHSPEWLVNLNISVHFYLQTLSVHSERFFGRWIKLLWLDLREMSLISPLFCIILLPAISRDLFKRALQRIYRVSQKKQWFLVKCL